jgi:hypothetical protein
LVELEVDGYKKHRRMKEVLMESAKTDSARSLLLWSALIVVRHFIAVLWHLLLVVKVQLGFPAFAPPLLILVNFIPVTGVVALANGFPKLAGSVIAIPLGIALVIGLYAHFLSPGTDNVFRMPPGELRLPFRISTVLLVLLEALGSWLGLRISARAKGTR